MKKIILVSLLSLLVFIGCDGIPNEVIDVSEASYKLISISAPDEFIYNAQDSIFTATVSFSESNTIARVWFNIITDDGSSVVKSNVQMTTSTSSSETTTYSGNTTLGKGIPTGKYVAQIFVEDNVTAGDDKVRKVAAHNFEFLSSELNIAPVLSDLVMDQSVQRGEQFVFSVKVEDDNGYLDIKRVFYEVFDPLGNQLTNSNNISEFPMFDDGETGGDVKSHDSIFTVALTFPNSFDAGNYRFEISAEDRVGAISNKLIQILTVN